MTGDTPEAPIRPAATVVLVRRGRQGPEVLLLERNRHSTFVAGAHVFPGGGLDAADQLPEIRQLCTAATASSDSQALAYRVAAIRESFEEAGVLLARTSAGSVLESGIIGLAGELERYRDALLQGQTSLQEICRQQAWQLDTASLHYYSRWITPPGQIRRYDTRFFVCEAPPGQEGRACQRETVAHTWLTPGRAIDRWRKNEISLVFPTAVTLQELADLDSVEAILATARTRQSEEV